MGEAVLSFGRHPEAGVNHPQRREQPLLAQLAERGLLKGKTIGIDATTLEANAAMRSIVRRDTGEDYDEYLTTLAKASGIETPTREDLAKLDKKRKKKASNDDWEHPHDPDAKITKMKDGRTHLLERPFAHCYVTGGMRRAHLRGHLNILKRILIHVATSNLGLLLRQLIGAGTPRGLASPKAELQAAISVLYRRLNVVGASARRIIRVIVDLPVQIVYLRRFTGNQLAA